MQSQMWSFFLLYRGRPKKDYKPLSCMSHISHSIPFSGIPITLFIWKYTNNTSGEHCNLYCHWSGLEGYAVGPWTKHITYIKYSTLLIIFSCIIVCVYIYIYIYIFIDICMHVFRLHYIWLKSTLNITVQKKIYGLNCMLYLIVINKCFSNKIISTYISYLSSLTLL